MIELNGPPIGVAAGIIDGKQLARLAARIQTAMKFPAILFVVNASEEDEVAPASLLALWVSVIAAAPRAPGRSKQKAAKRQRGRSNFKRMATIVAFDI